MNECIFCDIARGVAPGIKVFESDTILAFLDIRPISRGHTLVVPKIHAADLVTLDPSVAAEVFRVGQLLSRAVRKSDLAADGANLLMNDGKAAFQTVFHTHLHVVPRWNGDKLRFAAGFVTRRLKDSERTAAAIRGGLDRVANDDAA